MSPLQLQLLDPQFKIWNLARSHCLWFLAPFCYDARLVGMRIHAEHTHVLMSLFNYAAIQFDYGEIWKTLIVLGSLSYSESITAAQAPKAVPWVKTCFARVESCYAALSPHLSIQAPISSPRPTKRRRTCSHENQKTRALKKRKNSENLWLSENKNMWAIFFWAGFCTKSLRHPWSLSGHSCDSEHIKLQWKSFLHLRRDIQVQAQAIFHPPLTAAIKHRRVWLVFSENWKHIKFEICRSLVKPIKQRCVTCDFYVKGDTWP